MELADGRRFEIRWIPGAPSGQNYEILRELKATPRGTACPSSR